MSRFVVLCADPKACGVKKYHFPGTKCRSAGKRGKRSRSIVVSAAPPPSQVNYEKPGYDDFHDVLEGVIPATSMREHFESGVGDMELRSRRRRKVTSLAGKLHHMPDRGFVSKAATNRLMLGKDGHLSGNASRYLRGMLSDAADELTYDPDALAELPWDEYRPMKAILKPRNREDEFSGDHDSMWMLMSLVKKRQDDRLANGGDPPPVLISTDFGGHTLMVPVDERTRLSGRIPSLDHFRVTALVPELDVAQDQPVLGKQRVDPEVMERAMIEGAGPGRAFAVQRSKWSSAEFSPDGERKGHHWPIVAPLFEDNHRRRLRSESMKASGLSEGDLSSEQIGSIYSRVNDVAVYYGV